MAKKPDDNITDVAKPGTTAPSSSSRPIIVTHKPMVEDPMMVKESDNPSQAPKSDDGTPTLSAPEVAEAKPKASKAKASPDKKRLIIKPLDAEESTNTPESGAVITPSDTNSADPQQETAIAKAEAAVDEAVKEGGDEADENTSEATEPAPDEAQAKEEATESTDEKSDTEATDEATEEATDAEPEENPDADSGLVDELAKQAASKKQQQQEDKASAAQNEKLQEIIAAKTYYVPTTQVAKRRVKNVLITLILLALVAAVALNFTLDAELLDIGISPLTNIL